MSAVGRRIDPIGLAATSGAPDAGELIEAVTEAAKGLRYGSIEVVVHEGRIVQVVRTEKRRVTR